MCYLFICDVAGYFCTCSAGSPYGVHHANDKEDMEEESMVYSLVNSYSAKCIGTE